MIRVGSKLRSLRHIVAIRPLSLNLDEDKRRPTRGTYKPALFVLPTLSALPLNNVAFVHTSIRSFSSNSSNINSGSSSSSSSSTENDTTFSSSTISTGTDNFDEPSVAETLNKLFDEQQQLAQGSSSDLDNWYTAAGEQVVEHTPVWYNFADQSIVVMTKVHELTGLEMGWSIVATTIFMRTCLFPLMVTQQRGTSRMAHANPEILQLREKYDKLGTPSMQDNMRLRDQVNAVFKKYDFKPYQPLLAPIVQLPLLMGMFFGLRKMPDLYPEALAKGGMLWFPDLTVPDPNLILPFFASLSLLFMFEVNKAQMLASSPGTRGQIMLNFFRFVGIMSFPIMSNFHAALAAYWCTNNLISLVQTITLKNKAVRKYFGIWDLPKPVPGQDLTSSMENLIKRVKGEAVTEEQKIKHHNQEVEAKKTSFRMARATRERRRGITGTRNG